LATLCGRMAYEARMGSVRKSAEASSPLTAFLAQE
jgi:thiazole synthase